VTLCIAERRTFSDTNFFLILFFYFISFLIVFLFYEYCVLSLRVHGCAWQLLIKKYDDGNDDEKRKESKNYQLKPG